MLVVGVLHAVAYTYRAADPPGPAVRGSAWKFGAAFCTTEVGPKWCTRDTRVPP